MRIHELSIGRFGVWRDLSLPLTGSNLTVFYGPNEAGKSTLMRFIRSVLYGFQPQDERTPGPNPTRIACRGSIRGEHAGEEFEISRESGAGRGLLRINGDDHAARNEASLARILGGASESLFANVFAIGLNELQELATLDGADVARHVYGVSLGLDGERILRMESHLGRETDRLLGVDGGAGEIAELARRLDGFDHQIGRTGDVSQRHQDLLAQRERLEQETASARRRQADLQQNLRGRQFLQRVAAPWERERQLRMEMAQLPSIAGVTEDALDKLKAIEAELDGVETRRKKLIEEARRLHDQAEALQVEPQLEEHNCSIRKLVERAEEIRQIERTLPDRRIRVEALKKDCESRAPGGAGTAGIDAESLGLGASATHLLLERARRFRGAVSRRARIIRRYKQRVAALSRMQAALEEERRLLGGMSISQARGLAAKRLEELDLLSRLRVRQAALGESHEAVSEHLRLAVRPKEAPIYFSLCMWFFAVAGIILFAAGLYGVLNGLMRDGVGHTAWIIGACYALLGLCCGGVTWTMKEHFEPQQFDLSTLQRKQRDLEIDLSSVSRSIDRILQSESARPAGLLDFKVDASAPESVTEGEVMTALRRRLADLEALAVREQRIEDRRRALSQQRQLVQVRQRDVSAARREWCELLKRLGLNETIKISEAFRSWEQVAASRSLWADWQQLQRDYERDRQAVEQHRLLIEELSQKIDGKPAAGSPYALVADWDSRLRVLEEKRRERARLRQAGKQKRRDAEQFDGKISELRTARQALLTRCQSASRDELVSKLKAFRRHRELMGLLATAKGELDVVARAEPEMALVENDLLGFDSVRNKRSIESDQQELADLERELETSFEKLGRVKAELADLEQDRRVSSLRYDRAQVQTELQDAVERWAAGQASHKALARIRRRLETDGQTATLQAASRFLDKLTCSKYRRIWAPVGERHLVVDDEQQQSLRVEHLSSGAREQVFLAVRLAMVRDFSSRSAGLPLVLDDVVVNFDQIRTEAAVKTLLDLAEGGQQVLLFTCHLHLAHLFQNHGVEPVWLPANAASEFRYAS